jgi:hypothetical protein
MKHKIYIEKGILLKIYDCKLNLKFNLQSSIFANKRILRSLSFDNNGLVKPSCGTVALYGPFVFFYDMADYL